MIWIYASVTVVLARLAQGFLCGGEAPVSAVLMTEHTPDNSRGFKSSILCASSLAGALLGLLLSALCTSEFMPIWAWRIPFLGAGIFGLIGLYLRKEITESEIFLSAQNTNFKPLPKRGFLTVLSGIGTSANSLIPFYISTLYINQIFYGGLGFSITKTLNANAINIFLWMLLLPVAGFISDKVSKYKLMLVSSMLLFILGFYAQFTHIMSVKGLLTFQLLILFTSIFFVAPFNAYMTELFSPAQRCLKFSICTGIGAALFGAGTPFIIEFLSSYTPNPIQFYLCASGLIGATSIICQRILRQNTRQPWFSRVFATEPFYLQKTGKP